ncbi:hypothetical protein BDR03DRAFT_958057 [Suillus americanus]|nr:hypothetical protein BDR03DRAFT_958057 [Suillus americanus]
MLLNPIRGRCTYVHSWSARTIIITAIVLVFPNKNNEAREVTHWYRGTLGGWAWCSGSSTTSSGSAYVSTVMPAK